MKILENHTSPQYDAYTDWVDIDGNSIPEPTIHLEDRRRSIVDDAFVFNPPNLNDETSIANWIRIVLVFGKDYIYTQLRITEVFQSKTGATNTDKWNTCSDTEKDSIIYYNQFRGDEGDTAKVSYMIGSATYPTVVDVPTASAYLKWNHSESTGRAKPAAFDRVEGPKLMEIIINYLSPTDTSTLLATTGTMVNNYRNYVLIGTIIPNAASGLRDYIESTGDYVGNGLIEEPFITINGLALSKLRDDLIELLFENSELYWFDGTRTL